MENNTFNIEDFEEMELSDDKNSTGKSKEWLFANDLSDNMSISDLELTNNSLGLESDVNNITHLANKIFVFRQVLNGRPKKLVDKKGMEVAPILFRLLRTNPGKIKNSRLEEIKILLDPGAKKLGKIKTRLDNTNVWETAAKHISTMKIARLQL